MGRTLAHPAEPDAVGDGAGSHAAQCIADTPNNGPSRATVIVVVVVIAAYTAVLLTLLVTGNAAIAKLGAAAAATSASILTALKLSAHAARLLRNA